jgi:DNA-binding phage protein
MPSPSQLNRIYDRIQQQGGFHALEEKTGLTRSEILRALRDGETAENVEKIAHAIGYSVADLKGRTK